MLLVSIHDVTPALAAGVGRLWDLCLEQDIVPALFVVPDWHGGWPLERFPAFVQWLRDQAGQGTELVLHGERHDEVGLRRGLAHHWQAWGKTAGEGEFLTLRGSAAKARLQRGLDRLRSLDLHPSGFVPPAWLASPDTHLAARAAGLRFTEDAGSIYLFPSGRRLPSPVVRWSARSPLRAWSSVAVARARWHLQRRSPWNRIALHPQDLQHRAVGRSQRKALQRWLSRHRAIHYADLPAAVGSL
jgi:uncharacterized protein